MIRICHVITRMDWGGSPDIVRLLCANLDPERFEVTLVTGKTLDPSEKTREFLKGFKGTVVIVPSLRRDINPLLDLAAFVRLFLLFRKEHFDIVHTHTAKAGFLGRLAAFFAGCRRTVHTPHGHNFYGYFGPLMSRFVVLLERLAGTCTSRFVFLTELERRDNIAFLVCNEKKAALIYSCIEPGFISRFKDKAEARRALGLGEGQIAGMIGRLETVKGPRYFVEAALTLSARFPGARFLIVGEGSLRGELEARIANRGLKDRFILMGWREDIPEILSALDVLVLPSLNEAFGLVLIQAQAAGVPVVASAVGGVAEAVCHRVTGILVPPADPSALAAATARLLSEPAAAVVMGQKGREWSGRFTLERMVKSHEDLYMGLMEKR
ncbi:MAG: glycosyltransferase family 4 protein [Deltaproteobacteria bacterium]